MKLTRLAFLLIGIGLYAGASHAEELNGTLQKIKNSGSIALGVRDSSIPFSFIDDKQNYQGYSVDLCMNIVNAVQKELGLASLKVVMTPVATATRIPLMANGTIDLECGASTNNLERQKQVSFAPTSFVSGNRLLSKKSSNIKSLADLKGKSIVSLSGSSNLKQIVALNNSQNLGMNVMTAQDHPEAFMMVETGRAAAYAMDDILLASMIANSKNPNDFEISKDALSVEPYGIMLRKDDPAFKKIVDATLTKLYKSGDIDRIYNKWFVSAIPPKGINLNWAATDQLKMIFANPTDSGDPATYAVVPELQKPSQKNKVQAAIEKTPGTSTTQVR